MACSGKGDKVPDNASDNSSEYDDKMTPITVVSKRSAQLTWQMSTPVSQARAEMVPEIAAMYKSILDSLGENSSREGLLDTPLRAAKAMLFFTKVPENSYRIVFLISMWYIVFLSTCGVVDCLFDRSIFQA